MEKLFINLIEFYQKYLSFDRGILMILAPGSACKYEISCSQYMKEAVISHGPLKGLLMGIKRIWSCK